MSSTATVTARAATAATAASYGTSSPPAGNAPEALHVVPTFTDKHAERAWAKKHMAAAFRTFARLGWADGASGHISLRDPVHPELFWISE